MSEIPDWLRELATESDQEEFPGGGLSGDAEDTPVPDDSNASAESPSAVEVTPSSASEETRTQSSDSEGDLDLMEQLRNQVDSEEEESEPSSPALSFSLDNVIIEGLEPVQQFVLAVLLFLDVLVIGLLFLVMLGRIAI